jgi:hypothetical protein
LGVDDTERDPCAKGRQGQASHLSNRWSGLIRIRNGASL